MSYGRQKKIFSGLSQFHLNKLLLCTIYTLNILYWYRFLWLTFSALNCVPKTYRMVIFYTCFDKRVTTGKQKAFLSHLENPVKSDLKGFLLKYALEPIEKNFYVYFWKRKSILYSVTLCNVYVIPKMLWYTWFTMYNIEVAMVVWRDVEFEFDFRFCCYIMCFWVICRQKSPHCS